MEAVTNAARHSNGTHGVVTLTRHERELEVSVVDDGDGIGDREGTGVGTESMRERAEEIGGTLTISSAPGRGTVVVAHLPLTEPGRDEERIP